MARNRYRTEINVAIYIFNNIAFISLPNADRTYLLRGERVAVRQCQLDHNTFPTGSYAESFTCHQTLPLILMPDQKAVLQAAGLLVYQMVLSELIV